MTRTDLHSFLCQHGRITGLIAGNRTQLWGMITEIEKNCLNFVDHANHFHIFFNKDVYEFIPGEIDPKHKYEKERCDCGHKSEDMFTCERCGKTFCGKCGHQKRIDLINQNICKKCLEVINNH